MPRSRVLSERHRAAAPATTTTLSRSIVVDGHEVVRLDADCGRVRVSLVMPGIGRTVEVTGAPTTTLHALDDAAARSGTNPSRIHATARRVLGEVAERAGAWQPPDDGPLIARLGGASYPLLGAAYSAGAGPIGSIPRWADSILAEEDPRRAATRAFGPRATRPVIAALARSLVREAPEPVDLSRLAFALIGRDALPSDHLATLLVADGPSWPPSALPTPRRLEASREATQFWGPVRTWDYLRQTASDASLRQLFAECVDAALELRTHAPIHLPSSLTELRALYRLQIRSAPAPGGRRTPPRPRGRSPRPAPAPDGRPTPPRPRGRSPRPSPGPRPAVEAPVEYGMYHPPSVDRPTPVAPSTPITHPAWLERCDRATTNDFTFVLPRVCADLARWSRSMANCLDTYGPAAVAGASHLIGVTVRGRLHYVVEVTPEHRIRQFSGPANRPVDRQDHDLLLGLLRSLDVVR